MTDAIISIVLSDRWHSLSKFGLRFGSPEVGFTRVQLLGTVAQWTAAREYVAKIAAVAKGSNKGSATSALKRIDDHLEWEMRRA